MTKTLIRVRDRGRNPREPTCVSYTVRQLVEIINQHKWSRVHICDLAGVNRQYIDFATRGKSTPNIVNLEAVLQVMGYKITIVPIDEEL